MANYKFQMMNFNGVIVCTMNREFANKLAELARKEDEQLPVLSAFSHGVRRQCDLMSDTKESNDGEIYANG